MLVNLKSALSVRGYTQWRFSLLLEIPPSVLSEIVHERRRPDPSLRARIASILQADAGWLFSSVTHIPEPGPREESAPVPMSE